MGGNSSNTKTLQAIFGVDGSKLDAISEGLAALLAAQNNNSPTSVFGELLTTEPSPVYQASFVNTKGLPRIIENTANGGTVTFGDDSLAKLATGTALGGYAAIRTKEYLRYNPGKGTVGKMTTLFTNSAALSIQLAGMGTAEAGFYVGYDGLKFGIAVQTAGRLEIQSYQVDSKSTTTENLTVTLNGAAFSVPVTDQTAGTESDTAAEIAEFSYAGWEVYAVDNTVYFHAVSTGINAGAFSISGTTISGDFTQNQAGVANVFDWYYQDPEEGQTWNYNGGTGLDFTLDVTKGNIYRITFGYLGFDGILFEVKSPVSKAFIPLHYYDHLNVNTTPNTQDPSMQGLMAVASLGSNTNLELHTASIAGDVQGEKTISGEPFGASHSATAIPTSSSFYNILSIRVDRTFGAALAHKINRGQIKLFGASLSLAAAKPGEVAIFVNASIAGTANVWTPADPSADSMVSIFTGLKIVTGGREIDAKGLSKDGLVDFDIENLDKFLQAGDIVTIAVRIPLGGAAADAVASLNWKEDN